MDNRDIILRCLYENWPDEVSMIGNDWVARIVDVALSGERTEFLDPGGGFNFDLNPYIDTIIMGATLLVALAQLYMEYVALHAQPRDPGRTKQVLVTEQDVITKEDLINILVQYLTETMQMERGMATKLARLFIRVSSDGR